jgi:hypothetical protein
MRWNSTTVFDAISSTEDIRLPCTARTMPSVPKRGLRLACAPDPGRPIIEVSSRFIDVDVGGLARAIVTANGVVKADREKGASCVMPNRREQTPLPNARRSASSRRSGELGWQQESFLTRANIQSTGPCLCPQPFMARSRTHLAAKIHRIRGACLGCANTRHSHKIEHSGLHPR